MSKLNEVLSRLKRQYSAYEEERNSDDEDGFIDVSLACDLADSVPYLIKQAEKVEKIQMLSKAEDITLADFAKETLMIIEGREKEIRTKRS